ncbi:phytanoyl-CoA dioxygenase family protein [Algoriphagus aquimarinus]|uniref:phytanoyl-CoA dioxygenase family protein n=1 Tax=Algoriphagus aquimarinus TaxID=237018 RepID=UPI0030D792C8|tara:strand:+ start:23474 stop:24472 length:999 start_codon:yes stop_codon:yes gene_type:complete
MQTAEITDVGRIPIYYLKKIWCHYQNLKSPSAEVERVEWKYIIAVFNALGIGLEPTVQYLFSQSTDFSDFEDWIVANGSVSLSVIEQFNSTLTDKQEFDARKEDPIFTEQELQQWHQDGYIILKNAISKEACEKTVQLIYQCIEADPENSETWYKPHTLKNGIMIQLFNSPQLDQNRLSERINRAYRQLWQKSDLLVSMDRVSFNPPETEFYHFPGPNLHWDVSLKMPIPFGLQGLLYLTDTKANQGAFTLIPGFHNEIKTYLDNLKPADNPRDLKNLSNFPTKSIAAAAGDFIIWNQCLPHGSSPNTSKEPRIVQYINYQPLEMEVQSEWI